MEALRRAKGVEVKTPRRPAVAAVRHPALTRRQKEVLYWVALGKTNAEIGKIIGMATGTARNHVERLVLRYGINCSHSRVLLAAFALARNDLHRSVLRSVLVAARAGVPARKNIHRRLRF